MRTSKSAKILLTLSVILLIAFSGCTAKNEQTVTTPGGDVKVSEGSGPSWCKAGTTTTQTGPNGMQAMMSIKGITTYEGKEVCESSWESGEGSYTMYQSADSTYGMMIIKDKSGNVVNKVDISQPKK